MDEIINWISIQVDLPGEQNLRITFYEPIRMHEMWIE